MARPAHSGQDPRLCFGARGVQREQLLPVDRHVARGLDAQADFAPVDVDHGDADVFADVDLFAQFAAEYQHGRDSSFERDGGRPAFKFYATIEKGVDTGGAILYSPQLPTTAVAVTAPTTAPIPPHLPGATVIIFSGCARRAGGLAGAPGGNGPRHPRKPTRGGRRHNPSLDTRRRLTRG